jgi:hypothetical protein
MLYSRHVDANSTQDVFEVAPHGFQVTHYDALGHMNFDGEIYNRRRRCGDVGWHPLRFGHGPGPAGIFTRAILLDVAAALGKPYLDAGDYVEPDHLEAAEAAVGVRASSGALCWSESAWAPGGRGGAPRTRPSARASRQPVSPGSTTATWPSMAGIASSGFRPATTRSSDPSTLPRWRGSASLSSTISTWSS